jgi:potassium efflux system protein
LVAAASVGLGFGLQEIFANFVSGIILLFERPMRVGDVITIGNTTGTVSRIRFRATTIVDGDRKELIVPNKSFITGNLLNWTLSDSVNRVALKVGVAYGSDPNKVRELLLKIASEHPSILKDPAPTASLEELGDSALVFQMRAFLPTLKDRQKATHELNTMIHDRFRAAGIDIPFPQQEVTMNVRSMPPRHEPHTDLHGSLDVALKRAGVNV